MRYLFSTDTCDYYENNYKFYKVCGGKTTEVNIDDEEALRNYYDHIL